MDNEVVELSKGDLKVMIGIIKICLDRGSFQDNEMNKVNDILDKLSFLLIPRLELHKINQEINNIPFDRVISDLDDLPKIEELPDFFYEVADEIPSEVEEEIMPKIPTITIFPLSPIQEVEEEYENERKEKPKIKLKNLAILNSVLE